MKVAFIIGSEGQDGILLSRFLKEKDYQIIGFSRSKNPSNKWVAENLFVDLSKNNFLPFIETIRYYKPSELYYFAAYHTSSQQKSDLSIDEINRSTAINYSAFVKIIDLCREFSPQTKIQFTSSSLIFSGCNSEIQSENTVAKPTCLYSLNKLASMNAAKFYRNNFNMFVSVGIMYNHESVFRKNYFLSKKIIEQVRDFKDGKINEITIGNLDAVTDWGYAPDYVEALWHLVQLNQSDDYIISSGIGHQVKDWFLILEDHLEIKIMQNIQIDASLVNRKKPTLIGDNSKLLSTGWKPKHDFKRMIIKMYNNEI
tara:strand:- start:24616 stop:25554 length:939 start_codon:yes stop_codon:yes gene_type:complete